MSSNKNTSKKAFCTSNVAILPGQKCMCKQIKTAISDLLLLSLIYDNMPIQPHIENKIIFCFIPEFVTFLSNEAWGRGLEKRMAKCHTGERGIQTMPFYEWRTFWMTPCENCNPTFTRSFALIMVLEQTKTFAQIRKSDTPPRVFFTFFKMCKWYQMARNVSNVLGPLYFSLNGRFNIWKIFSINAK